MKKYSSFLGFLFSLFLVVALSVFSVWKNKDQNQLKTSVSFEKTSLFLSDSIVNKLLTQKTKVNKIKAKDSLDLNMLEVLLQDIPEVENAEVYQHPTGDLKVVLLERNPLFRVLGKENYYVDRFGKKFPLSKKHVADVPIFIGKLSEEMKPIVVALVSKLQEDSFLKNELIHLTEDNGVFRIGIRSLPYDFIFGKHDHVSSKIKKIKVFCAFQREQKPQKIYQSANLIYKNQVVVTSL